MSDLISRSELIKHFEAIQQQENVVGLEFIAMIDEIKEQPTAYDIDKVVEKLEERKALYERLVGYESKNGTSTEKNQHIKAIDVLNDAIEIVKQGGVSDDVCEWWLCDEEANVYDTSCRNPHILIEGTPQENNYEFCPYCGKKILCKE